MDIEKIHQDLGFKSAIYHYNPDYEIKFRISLPREYGLLPELIEIEGLRKMKYGDIFDYFEELLDLDIRYLNGLSIRMRPSMMCDYCSQLTGYIRYQCTDCWRDMCLTCYSEKSKEDAKKNNSRNYHLREKELKLCQESHNLKRLYDNYNPICSQCQNKIEENFLVMSKFASDCSRESQRFNLCLDCLKTSEGGILAKEKNLKILELKILPNCDQSGFGSLLDWVPIYESDHDDEASNIFLLYNINKMSPDYGKIACCTKDDHGRIGYYQLPEPYSRLGQNVKELIEKHLMESLKVRDEIPDSWDAFYCGPLQLAMNELGMMIHYG